MISQNYMYYQMVITEPKSSISPVVIRFYQIYILSIVICVHLRPSFQTLFYFVS